MKKVIIFILFLLLIQSQNVFANTLTWTDNSGIENGFAVEMLSLGSWVEVGRVAASVTTFTDAFTEGIYRVRAFVTVPGQSDVFSAYSNTAVKLNGPVNATIN